MIGAVAAAAAEENFFSANNGKSFQHFEAVLCCNFELFSVDSGSFYSPTQRSITQTHKQINMHKHTHKQRV